MISGFNHSYRFWLNSKSHRKFYEIMYSGLKTDFRKNPIAVHYLPITMFRRLIFVMIPLFASQYEWMQLQIIIFLQSNYVVLYLWMNPHEDKRVFLIHLFNEEMILWCLYHMFLFSPFVNNEDWKFGVFGLSFVSVLGLMIFVNIFKIALDIVNKC